ncbi:MAG: DUF2127 domain-containing protein [Betaproteobacteria bacterium]
MTSSRRAVRLHRFFELAILFKGLDGLLQTIAGIALLFVPLRSIYSLVTFLTARELADDPDAWLANTVQHAADALSPGSKNFASAYLISHGVVKLFLVYALWREKLWAFPVALAFIGGFIAYQLYRVAHTHSITLVVFTVIDLIVCWLVWREYVARRQLAH